MAHAEYKSRALSLVKGLYLPLDADNNPHKCRPTIYETAWVAMLSETTTMDNGSTELLYPDSFQYLLDHQQAHGGWEMGDFKLGTMLNTLAGLLAITKRRKSLFGRSGNAAAALDLRASKAIEFLRGELAKWDPKSSAHLGSIALVPLLLEMLRTENIHFQHWGSAQVEERIAHSPLSQSEGLSPMPYLLQTHMDAAESLNLEDGESCHGISCSPSSVAAFLLASETRDEECAAYLSAAIKATGTRGGVPSVFPPSLNEAAYTIEVLTESGLYENTITNGSIPLTDGKALGQPSLCPIHKILDLSTQLLMYKLSAQTDEIQQRDQLETQLLSRIEACDTSFDERCRILKTLLRSPSSDQSNVNVSSIFKAICASWWHGTRGSILSRSPLYQIMLFAECFLEIFELSHHKSCSLVSAEDLEDRAPIIIVQMLANVLSSQNSDGSWGLRGCSETTAYALLALIAMAKLPQVRILNMEIRHAVERGRQALSMMSDSWAESHSLWIGKTAYGSDRLSEAFSLAAMQKPFELYNSNEQNEVTRDKKSQKVLALAKFFHGLDNLAKEPISKIKAGALESALYVSMLKTIRNDIFPPTAAKEKDKYLDYIPIMWSIHSIVRGIFAPPQFIWDIAVLSMFIFLVDEYMESKVASFTSEEFFEFRKGVEKMFKMDDSMQPDVEHEGTSLVGGPYSAFTTHEGIEGTNVARTRRSSNETAMDRMKKRILLIELIDSSSVHSDRVRNALSIFGAWARYHMTYESVVSASVMDLLDLRVETRNYLLYHIHQLEDNQRFANQHHSSLHLHFLTPRMGYAPWLHTVGGGHIGAPIGLAFFACITGSRVRGKGKDCFSSVQQKLMAWNCNMHAAKQLRMYNDYGSVARDAEENNLNSVDFPEFFGDGDEARDFLGGQIDANFGLMQTKQTLLAAAEYERRHTNIELDELYKELEAEGAAGKKIADWLGVYYAGGDQFSDMYLVRDVTNGIKQGL